MIPLFYLSLISLGTTSYMAFNYHLTGDFMAFAHAQVILNRHLGNPLEILINSYHGDIYTAFNAAFASLFSLFLSFFTKKSGFLTGYFVCTLF